MPCSDLFRTLGAAQGLSSKFYIALGVAQDYDLKFYKAVGDAQRYDKNYLRQRALPKHLYLSCTDYWASPDIMFLIAENSGGFSMCL